MLGNPSGYPPRISQSRAGKRAAEKIDQYLQQGDLPAAMKLAGRGRMNSATSPVTRNTYNEELYRRLLIG